MRPGMECLLEVLRGEGFSGGRSESQWNEVLALAEEERVLAWIAARMREHIAELPAAIAEHAVRIGHEETKTAFFWCAELKSILRAFHERGIPAAPLKGPFLAYRIYGDAALRPCRDLDLLVAKWDRQRAEERLIEIGFSPAGEMDDYHRAWLRRTTQLELHYDAENPLAFDFHTAQALERAVPAEFMGESCLRFAPEDELLYLCLHAARHRYERLGLVLDLALAFERLAPQNLRPRSEVENLNGLLVLGVLMARRLAPGLRDGWDSGVSGSERRHLETIADGLWLRLRTEASSAMDWRGAHAFYVALEPTVQRRVKRRLRHARILATRTIDRDRLFAARFGLSRDWQVRALRPLRLLMEQGRR